MNSLQFLHDLNVPRDATAAEAVASRTRNALLRAKDHCGGAGSHGDGSDSDVWAAASPEELAAAAAAEGPGGKATRVFVKRFDSRQPNDLTENAVPPPPQTLEFPSGSEAATDDAAAQDSTSAMPVPPASALEAVLQATAGSAVASVENVGAAAAKAGGAGDDGGASNVGLVTTERLAEALEAALPDRTGVRDNIQQDVKLLKVRGRIARVPSEEVHLMELEDVSF